MCEDAARAGLVLALAFLTCAAVADSNTTYCWGNGQYGSLGDGNGTGRPYNSVVPTPVQSTDSFTSVSAGYMHACALTRAGKAYCWGSGLSGELGTGNITAAQNTPAAVASDLAWTQIAAGERFSCGISGSRAYCWGSGVQGKLGDGRNASSSTPVEVAGSYDFKEVAVGTSHACGLAIDGQAWCWGSGFFGQLGAGTTDSSSVPVQVAGGHTFSTLTAGSAHTCGLEADSGRALCWGSNIDGQVGAQVNGTATEPVAVATDRTFFTISAGSDFTCALDANNPEPAAWCWGSGIYGQLGNDAYGSDAGSSDPVQAAGTRGYESVSAGHVHTCAVANDRMAAWCWGLGRDGQLGTGSKGQTFNGDYLESTPVSVNASFPFFSLSAGGSFTCGVSPKAATPTSPQAPPVPPGGQPPPPLPMGPPDASVPSSTSVPVAAIAGAVAGAAVATGLAYLMFRPGKGWLRHKGAAVSAAAPQDLGKDGSDSDMKVQSSMHLTPFGTDSLLPTSTSSLSASQLTSLSGKEAALRVAGSNGGSESDAMLSYISSYLGSRPQAADSTHRAQQGFGVAGNSRLLQTEAQMWQVDWSELQIGHTIGSGAYGCVYLAHWRETQCAVKVLLNQEAARQKRRLELPESVMRELEAEAQVMIRIRHPNVLQFLGLCALPPALITEYCSRGSMYDCLQAGCDDPAAARQLTWARRLAMAVGAATGLYYLHSRNIVHRDVKSPNYLVDEHWRVKVSDFNLSRLLAGDEVVVASSAGGGPGNPIWLAPEALRGARGSAASDVFSFGVVLWELLTWRLPWRGSGLGPFQIGAKVVAGERLELPPLKELPGPDNAAFAGLDAYCQLIQECWAQDAASRPSMAQVVRRLRTLLQHLTGSEPAAGVFGEA